MTAIESLQSIQPEAFEIRDSGSCALIGGYCASSGHYHFPLQDCCPYTGAPDVERVELSTEGSLWGWTAVTAAPPGYEGPVPYGFGVVELTKERLRIITRLTESDPGRLEFGRRMTLVTDEVAERVAAWAFAPAESG
jgi:uncharacterized OB-fold protein